MRSGYPSGAPDRLWCTSNNEEHDMQTNEGNIDRIVRLVIAAAAIALAAVVGFGSVAGIVAVVVAVIMVATAATGFCPLYAVFGVSTCPNRVAE
jgi:uncharacterized membrane protein